MITPVLIDIFIVAALVFFAWRGSKKGFVLTLCSLVAVLVALIGATIITNAAAPKVAEYLQPRLEQSIRESLEEKALEVNAQDSLGVADVLSTLREKGGVYEWAADGLEGALRSSPGIDSIAHQASVVAAGLAQQLARVIIFAVAFVLLLIAWAIFSHALDLVAKLPVINTLNNSLGSVMGFFKGVVVIYICAWLLCGPLGLIPPQIVSGSRLLPSIVERSPLDFFPL